MTLRRVTCKHESVLVGAREKVVESVKKGVPKSETARCFGVDRATVKRYCKQLDEHGTLEPRKALARLPSSMKG
jgi:transposase